MTSDSLKRLIVMILGAVFLAASPILKKFGLAMDPEHALAFAGLVVGFLMQSGLKSALERAAASKALGTILTDASKVKAVFDQLKAAQALDAGKQAATSSNDPSNN